MHSSKVKKTTCSEICAQLYIQYANYVISIHKKRLYALELNKGKYTCSGIYAFLHI